MLPPKEEEEKKEEDMLLASWQYISPGHTASFIDGDRALGGPEVNL